MKNKKNEKGRYVGVAGKSGDKFRFVLNMEERSGKCLMNGYELIGEKEWKNLPERIIPVVCLTEGTDIRIRFVSSS